MFHRIYGLTNPKAEFVYYDVAARRAANKGRGRLRKQCRLETSHLLTYDPKTGKTEDLGEMRLEDGRRVIGTNAADTGPDGAIYFVGP